MVTVARNLESLSRKLQAFGFLKSGVWQSDAILAAVRDAQLYLGGRVSDSEAYTHELLDAPRCGCSEPIVTRDGLSKWSSNGPIKLYLTPGLPKLSMATWKSLVGDACARVMGMCGLVFVIVDDPRQANHIYRAANLDGAGRVLAQCELPYGVEQTRATFTDIDISEDWGVTSAQRMISALDVLIHEGGHRDGISHVPASEDRCIMNPIYDPSLRATLQPRDVAEYRKRYGLRPATPAPTPTTPAGPEIVIRLGGGSVLNTTFNGGPSGRDVIIRATGVPSIDGYLVSKRPG